MIAQASLPEGMRWPTRSGRCRRSDRFLLAAIPGRVLIDLRCPFSRYQARRNKHGLRSAMGPKTGSHGTSLRKSGGTLVEPAVEMEQEPPD